MNNGAFGVPGTGASVFSAERQILWGGDESRIKVLRNSVYPLSSAMVDAGNSPTNWIREGLILGKISSSGKLIQWDPTATDGSESIFGVLGIQQDMVDGNNVAVDRYCPVLVVAPVKASQLLIGGSALVGHANEYVARRQLHLIGFVLDDDPQGYKAGVTPRQAVKATDYTVVAADNGTQFIAITANATFTLPAIKVGLSFEFVRASDHNLVVSSPDS